MTVIEIERHLEGAGMLIDARRYEAGLQAVSQALSIDPANAQAHALACRALLGMGRHYEAIHAAQQAVTLAPGWHYPHRLTSIALQAQAKASKTRPSELAVAAAREAVRLAPMEPFGYTTLAEACAKAGRLTDADQAVRQAIRLNPADANVWTTASFVAVQAKNWYAAEKAARHALAIEPDNYAATNNLGVAMKRQGYWTQGAVAFGVAARTDPRSSTARDNIEGIGFTYLVKLVPFVLLPLLVVVPAFFAARVAMTLWLSKRPERLKPMARKIGLRLATSKRQQHKFERHNARVQKAMTDARASANWSALAGRRRGSNGFLGAAGLTLVIAGLAFIALAVTAPDTRQLVGSSILGLLVTIPGGLMLRSLSARRRAL